jgi:Domain of unknown function (DUF6894)
VADGNTGEPHLYRTGRSDDRGVAGAARLIVDDRRHWWKQIRRQAIDVQAGSLVRSRTDKPNDECQNCPFCMCEAPMGHFYFHLQAGEQLIIDMEGQDLPDLSAARREAIQSAREILAAAIRAGKATVPDAFVISDEAGHALDIVALVEALPEPLK